MYIDDGISIESEPLAIMPEEDQNEGRVANQYSEVHIQQVSKPSLLKPDIILTQDRQVVLTKKPRILECLRLAHHGITMISTNLSSGLSILLFSGINLETITAK